MQKAKSIRQAVIGIVLLAGVILTTIAIVGDTERTTTDVVKNNSGEISHTEFYVGGIRGYVFEIDGVRCVQYSSGLACDFPLTDRVK